ncbi:MAG: hypothetical protein A2W22_01315 [Candidatus Levybacteria bacterium RBG_16_35_11]|nr:MAG: hypothetical protein A2W22_01315 [Candidatus Levybacteria bacterium RBG_16_35_11]
MAKSKGRSRGSLRRKLSIIAFVAIIIAIPLTVVISQQQQETRQQAAGTECIYAFRTLSICNSYCSSQSGKTCLQSLSRRWGCCSRTISPTPAPTIGTPLNWCSLCSDTYKFCRISWQGNQTCTDNQNAKYTLDCSCTQGTINCGVKGINTSSCKSSPTPYIPKATPTPIMKVSCAPAENQAQAASWAKLCVGGTTRYTGKAWEVCCPTR